MKARGANASRSPAFPHPQCSCPQETPALAKHHTLLQVQTESRTPGRCWSLATPSRPGNNDLETEKGQAGGENTLRRRCKVHSRFHPTLSPAPYRGAQLSFPLVAKLGQRKSYACSISQKVLQCTTCFILRTNTPQNMRWGFLCDVSFRVRRFAVFTETIICSCSSPSQSDQEAARNR